VSDTSGPRFLRFAVLGWGIGILLAGLWPFNFFPKNRVEWLTQQNGIHFGGYGEIYGPAPSLAPETNPSLRSLSVELWVRGEADYRTFSPILSLDERTRDRRSWTERFVIAQSLSDLVVEGQFQDRDTPSTRLYLDRACGEGKSRFLSVTSDREGTRVYLDGVFERASPSLDLASDNLSARLLVGHGTFGQEPWRGDVLGLAFYSRALTAREVAEHYRAWLNHQPGELSKAGDGGVVYRFDEHRGQLIHELGGRMPDLMIPSRFRVLRPTVLEFPRPLRPSDLQDAAVNILGFLPFGFLLTAYLREVANCDRGRALWAAVVVAGLASLGIELLQVYLPSRDSSLLDLLNNVLGSGLGALLELRFRAGSAAAP
jgi:VanZ family protein